MEQKQAAIRTFQMSERFIKNKDYKQASLKLSQARKHFPLLENIEAMINVCNILLVSHNLSSKDSTTDWYMVLQVDPNGNESHIASKYRDLVESFNPIKNTFPGTDSALEVLCEAFSVLSDKRKKLIFDLEKFNNYNMVLPPNKSDSSQLSSSRLRNITRGSGVTDAKREIPECKWSRKDFAIDQVWAVYDGPNSMPRRYVVVKNVFSGTEVCAAFLDPYPMLDEEKEWVEEGLPYVCGLFKPGRTMTSLSMSQFSHVVTCEVSTKSLYKIYPKKDEVWVVYKSWHPKWKDGDFKSHECHIIEVLSDFSEGAEMKIASLVEMDGYMTFFQRQQVNGFDLIRTITRMEMLSFSHQIPCFSVERSLHLEPDALPPRS